MFFSILNYLKKFLYGFFHHLGSFVLWAYNVIVPKSAKDALTKLVGKLTGAKFTDYVMTIFGFLKHWYFLLAIFSVVVVWRLYKALENAGVIAKFENIVMNTLNSVSYISEVCFPMILNISDLIQCIQTSP